MLLSTLARNTETNKNVQLQKKSCLVIAYTMTSMGLMRCNNPHRVDIDVRIQESVRSGGDMSSLLSLSTTIPLHICLLHAARLHFPNHRVVCWIHNQFFPIGNRCTEEEKKTRFFFFRMSHLHVSIRSFHNSSSSTLFRCICVWMNEKKRERERILTRRNVLVVSHDYRWTNWLPDPWFSFNVWFFI